jgi:hypothetical protein
MLGRRTDAREKDMSDREIVALREKLASPVRSDDYQQRCRDINARGLNMASRGIAVELQSAPTAQPYE